MFLNVREAYEMTLFVKQKTVAEFEKMRKKTEIFEHNVEAIRNIHCVENSVSNFSKKRITSLQIQNQTHYFIFYKTLKLRKSVRILAKTSMLQKSLNIDEIFKRKLSVFCLIGFLPWYGNSFLLVQPLSFWHCL